MNPDAVQILTFVAKGDCVIASLSRDKVHELENQFYQMRDELMKVRISLIDGSASEFDFFRYCEPLKPEARKAIRKKFRDCMHKFMKQLK